MDTAASEPTQSMHTQVESSGVRNQDIWSTGPVWALRFNRPGLSGIVRPYRRTVILLGWPRAPCTKTWRRRCRLPRVCTA